MNIQLNINLCFLKQVADIFETGLIIIDQNHRILLWNNCIENHTDISSDQAIDLDVSTLLHRRSEQWLSHQIQMVLNADKPSITDADIFNAINDTRLQIFPEVNAFTLSTDSSGQEYICLVVNGISSSAKNNLLLHGENEKLKEQVRRDSATQLLTKNYWWQCLIEQFNHSQTSGISSSLVIFDVDEFKRINDQYGHLAGDEAIKRLAYSFRKTIRNSDIACRFGGDEFAVILPNTNANEAYIFAELLRKKILNLDKAPNQPQISISVGVCEWTAEMVSEREWFDKADKALYMSKQKGRNQTTEAINIDDEEEIFSR
ncbi:MAG: sensor domain-containing diguanylate cyclase [Moritella sp.]|uniref:sensor domain-containing diguanylate cyclase n=1 Tax=Moritella sp. TaxID=78556 RepID=UPI001D47E8A1|nr:sensor domain-containing diguanylate cyclase [Moritella sp.]NQZ50310.1 sensor domain-containing diguanylate cyclase [Moritella sp.]